MLTVDRANARVLPSYNTVYIFSMFFKITGIRNHYVNIYNVFVSKSQSPIANHSSWSADHHYPSLVLKLFLLWRNLAETRPVAKPNGKDITNRPSRPSTPPMSIRNSGARSSGLICFPITHLEYAILLTPTVLFCYSDSSLNTVVLLSGVFVADQAHRLLPNSIPRMYQNGTRSGDKATLQCSVATYVNTYRRKWHRTTSLFCCVWTYNPAVRCYIKHTTHIYIYTTNPAKPGSRIRRLDHGDMSSQLGLRSRRY